MSDDNKSAVLLNNKDEASYMMTLKAIGDGLYKGPPRLGIHRPKPIENPLRGVACQTMDEFENLAKELSPERRIFLVRQYLNANENDFTPEQNNWFKGMRMALGAAIHRLEVQPELQAAKQYFERQSKTASNPRPIKNEVGETLDNVIAILVKNHPNEKPSALWIHLKTAIEEWSDGDCIQKKPSQKSDSWRYEFHMGEKINTITFGIFRKKLKK